MPPEGLGDSLKRSNKMYQVKNGKQVVPTCPECGCRLAQFEDMWYHFEGTKEKDARGCLCSLYLSGQEFIIDPKNGFDNGSIVVV